MHFGGKFITQKLLGTPNLVVVGHLIGPQFRIFFKIKNVVNGPYSAQPQGQANVWLSQHTLVIILNLTTTYFFKTSFESSQATPGNPS